MTDAEAGDTQGEALLLQNLAVLLPALRALGIRRVEVTYAGARARCHRCEVTALPVNALARLRETPVVFRRRAADAGQPSVETFADTLPLSEAMQRFTLHWASLKFGYWQQADGLFYLDATYYN